MWRVSLYTDVELDLVHSGVGDCHYSHLGWRMPCHLRVPKLGAPNVNDWVLSIGLECVAPVSAVPICTRRRVSSRRIGPISPISEAIGLAKLL